MLDIIEIRTDGRDLRVENSAVPKAANVISVQLQSLEYLQDFGVDFDFFLTSNFQIQNESFRAHIVDRLSRANINVSQVIDLIQNFIQTYTFSVTDTDLNNSGGLIS